MLFRLFAHATPEGVRARLRRLLGFWSTTQIASRCEELRYLGVEVPQGFLPPTLNLATFVLDRNRYVYRVKYGGGDSHHCYVVERTLTGTFIDPPKAKIAFDERPQRFWHGADKVLAALRVFDDRGPQSNVDVSVFARIAEGTGLSQSAAALAWLGAIQPWIPDLAKQFRKPLGVKVAEIARAMDELSAAGNLEHVYTLTMPETATELLDSPTAIDRFIHAWNTVHPRTVTKRKGR
jgi:hypothetical protein